MKDLIHAFPDNIKEAIAIAEASDLKTPSNKIKNIVTVSYTHLTLPTKA